MATSKRKSAILARICIAMLLLALPAVKPSNAASTATNAFTVSATVQATCRVAATSLSFGTYTGLQTDATSTISITCTNTTPYNVLLNGGGDGEGGGGSVTNRKMKGPSGATLAYGLYLDAERDDVWGNTIGTNASIGTGNGASQALTVYGRVGAAQYVRPGGYSDTVTATVSY